MTSPRGRSPGARVCFALAATVYLALSLLVFAPVLRAPQRLLPYAAALDQPPFEKPLTRLDHQDEAMVVSVVVRNAATLVSHPWQLFGDGQCYPMPQAYTLGEHMFGLGLLTAAPWAFTHDPILSFNIALVLTLWLPALTMYALSWHFTRSATAAFVAGLLFELAPRRLVDPSHPYVHGDLFAPLALLFLHRLFARDRWRDGVTFAFFTTLTLSESLYPVAALGILLLVYVPYLAARHRSHLRSVLPKLVACAAWLLGAAWLVFGPYLHTRATWGLLSGREVLLYSLGNYGPGQIAFPGFVLLVLVAVALLDRLRGARTTENEDPRLAYLASAFLIVAVTIGWLWIPLLGVYLMSPLLIAQKFLPGLDAVRSLPAIGIGAGLPLAFVAGYGALALVERTPRPFAIVVPALVSALLLATEFLPLLARPSFGVDSFAMSALVARPPDEDVALVRDTAEGALLDLPFTSSGLGHLAMAEDLLRASYSPRPTASCYNSFLSPVQEQVGALAVALPDPRAAEALHALGFRTVLLEKGQLPPSERKRIYDSVRRQQDGQPGMQPLGSTERLISYRLTSRAAVKTDFALLASNIDAPADDPVQVPPAGGEVEFIVRNAGKETFRHPDPIEPSDLLLRWKDASGATALEQHARALLPMAIAARSSSSIKLQVSPPPQDGAYVIDLVRVAEPMTVLSRRVVARIGSAATPIPEHPS